MLERKKGWKNARIALGLVSAGLVSPAAMADPPTNCATDSYITDSKGNCVGDLIQSPAGPIVTHIFKNISSTPYTISGPVGTVQNLNRFIYPTSDCSGTAYIAAFSSTILGIPPQAFAADQVLWAPNINGVTLITPKAYFIPLSTLRQEGFSTAVAHCQVFETGSDYGPIVQQPGLYAPAQEISSTFIPRLVPIVPTDPSTYWKWVHHDPGR